MAVEKPDGTAQRTPGAGESDSGTGDGNSARFSQSTNEDEAWIEFYDWAQNQCWGPNCPTTGTEQFQAYADDLKWLGLPVEGLHQGP